jgi:predicted phosphodiesterase
MVGTRRPGRRAGGTAMLTAIVSDLHLGSRLRIDLLRDPAVLERLLDGLRGVDRLVLLGDTLELRDRPVADVLEVSRPVLGAVGEVMRGGQVVLVPGNHDHRIAREVLAHGGGAGRLGLANELPVPAGSIAERLRAQLACEMVLAYPGFFVAPRVWATHGHYGDVHSAALGLEVSLAVAGTAVRRALLRAPPRRPADYEAVLRPPYALFDGIAQARSLRVGADAGKRLVRALETRAGARAPAGPGRPVPRRGEREGTVAGERRRPGVLPVARMLGRLGVDADAVVFGHTHRVGPLPGDGAGWTTPAGTALHNTGSWVFEPGIYTNCRGADDALREDPYWPGAVTIFEDGRLLAVRRQLGGFETRFGLPRGRNGSLDSRN